METIKEFVIDQALIIIPVLYIIGTIIKGTEKINDKYIPLILLPISIIFCLFVVGFNVQGVIQGILVCGTAVYANQLLVQAKK